MTSSDYSLTGYASFFSNILYPLNENNKFKRLFKNKTIKILFNCHYWQYAALVVIEKGTIEVEGVKNNPAKKTSKELQKWDVYIEMDIDLYSRISMRTKTLVDLAKDWLRGKIKLKGKTHILDLIRLFNCLTKEKLTYELPGDWVE